METLKIIAEKETPPDGFTEVKKTNDTEQKVRMAF
jgi:Multivesicular body subunit 12